MTRYVLILVTFMFVCLGGLFAPAGAAHGRSELDVLGFSPDGRFFAFEQAGVNKRTGIAFADLFVVDTKDDSWVSGTPVRVLSHLDQGGGLRYVQRILDERVERLLRRLGLDRAATGVAFMPKDSRELVLTLPWGERDLVQLHIHSDVEAPGCKTAGVEQRGKPQGFYITLQRPTEVSVLHNDDVIPRSRGCARSYALHSAYLKDRGSDLVIAMILSYRDYNSEDGVDVHYLAVTKVIQAPAGGE